MLRSMTMSFTLNDHFDSTERYSRVVETSAAKHSKGERDGVHILREKIEIPRCAGLIERPRLIEKLEKSLSQFAATLVSGRAGTGKTSVAAAYARTRKRVAWFTVESSDSDWKVFASYLAASVHRVAESKKLVGDSLRAVTNSSPAAMALFLYVIASVLETDEKDDRPLLVFDGIHHLFDADWFGGFFNILQPRFPKLRTSFFCAGAGHPTRYGVCVRNSSLTLSTRKRLPLTEMRQYRSSNR